MKIGTMTPQEFIKGKRLSREVAKVAIPKPLSKLAVTELIGEAIKEARKAGSDKEYDWAIWINVALAKAGYRVSRMTPAEYAKQTREWERLEREVAFRKAERGEK